MEIHIITTPKSIEMANFLLKQAFDEAIRNRVFREKFNVTAGDIRCAEKFRKKLLEAFTSQKTIPTHQGSKNKMI